MNAPACLLGRDVAPLIGHLMRQSRAGKTSKGKNAGRKEKSGMKSQRKERNGWKKKGRDGKNRLKIWLQQWMGDPTGGIRFGGCELTIRCSMIGPWPLHRQVQSSNYLALIESDRLAIFSCFSLSPPFRPRAGRSIRVQHSVVIRIPQPTNWMTKRVLKVK